jgi:SAM-dependent methyltransferase
MQSARQSDRLRPGGRALAGDVAVNPDGLRELPGDAKVVSDTAALTSEDEAGGAPTSRCPLCDANGNITRLRFHQRYEQANAPPAQLTWSSCGRCHGWFADPMPNEHQIARHWAWADYAAPQQSQRIGDRKSPLFTRVLDGLEQRTRPGRLLDIGCNFGRFLEMAKARGWTPSGYEPYEEAAKRCIAQGYDVRGGWEGLDCGLAENQFDALTVVDVFCVSLHPARDLSAYHRLLRPGGVMAMRLTNKHLVLRAVESLTKGDRRDAIISRLLFGQLHSASPRTIRRWLAKAGFDNIAVEGRAMATPWSKSRLRSRLAYGGMEVLRAVTLGTINLSPGILVFARKLK